jgi:hypothetical protein
MQKIRSLLLAAGLFASIAAGTVLPLIQPAPALAASPTMVKMTLETGYNGY